MIRSSWIYYIISNADAVPYPESHGMCDAKLWYVPRPQRLEVIRQTDLASAVHLGRLAVQLGQSNLRSSGGVCHWDLKVRVC